MYRNIKVSFIALFFSLSSYSQTTNPPPSESNLTLSPNHVRNVYIGLKQGEACKIKLSEALRAAHSLDTLVQSLNTDLQAAVIQTRILNSQIDLKQAELLKKSVEIERLTNKKTPWWRHPITWGVLGFAAGVFITR